MVLRPRPNARPNYLSQDIAMAPVRIAVIGAGGLIGRRHCQHVLENPRASLCAIVDPGRHVVELEKTFEVPIPCYQSVKELVHSPHKPDAAIICTPNSTHVDVGIELAHAGVHILCEKPIAINVLTAKTLLSAAEKCGIKLLIGHHRRFNPYMIALKEVLSSGQLGQIIAVNGLWTTVKPQEYFEGVNSWRSEKGAGGPVLINFIHDLDLMHFLFGPTVSVHAENTTPQRSSRKDAVEEGAAIIFRFESGIVGSFLVSDNVASPHSFEQGTGENPALPKTGQDTYRVFGSKGTISFPDMTLSSYQRSIPSWNSTLTTGKVPVANATVAPLAAQLDHFVDVCLNLDKPACSGTEGMRALAACKAVHRALETGQKVMVSSIIGKLTSRL